MAKFVSVFGITLVFLVLLALLWPRFFDVPRPAPLSQLNSFIRQTNAGQNTAQVLGVSTEDSVEKITVQQIVGSVTETVRSRALDIAVTHIVREITRRFRELPQEHQERILQAIGETMNGTPSASPSIK